MLNLFQHLIKSSSYETLKRVQGDKKRIMTQSGRRESRSLRNWIPHQVRNDTFYRWIWDKDIWLINGLHMYKGSSLANKLGYMPDIDLFWTAMTII
jgi:hypothetical protein